MLFLDCPHCGRRSVEEFRYGEIPTTPDSIVDPTIATSTADFCAPTPTGQPSERWFHDFGCRRWLTVTRDTSTDEVL